MLDEQPIARHDLGGGAVAAAEVVRDARCPFSEGRELAAGMPECALVEIVAARQHQRDHRTGQHLAEGQRPRDREQGDHVGSCLSPADPAGDLAGERHADEHERSGPDDLCGLTFAAEQQAHAGGKRQQHDRGRERSPAPERAVDRCLGCHREHARRSRLRARRGRRGSLLRLCRAASRDRATPLRLRLGSVGRRR